MTKPLRKTIKIMAMAIICCAVAVVLVSIFGKTMILLSP